MSARRDLGLSAGSILVGETARTARGYYVRVSSVQFDSAGTRVRLELLKEGKRGEAAEFVGHLDLSGELSRWVQPLLRDAADQAGRRA
jgi:hypothetical protein